MLLCSQGAVFYCEQEQEVSITGRNWGNATLDGATMMFAVGSKPAFRIPLKDVNQVQQNKEEVCNTLASYAPHLKLRMCEFRSKAGDETLP